VAAVSMADMLSIQAGIGSDGDSRVTIDLEAIRDQLHMSPEEFALMSAFAECRRADVEDFFQLSH